MKEKTQPNAQPEIKMPKFLEDYLQEVYKFDLNIAMELLKLNIESAKKRA